MNPAFQHSLINHVLDMLRTRWPDWRFSAIRDETAVAVSSIEISLPNGIEIVLATDLDGEPRYSILRAGGGPRGRLDFEAAAESESASSGEVPTTDGLTAALVLEHLARYAKWVRRPSANCPCELPRPSASFQPRDPVRRIDNQLPPLK